MKKVFLALAIGIISLVLYECRPGYVVFMCNVYYNHISEGVGYERIHMNADVKTFKIDNECPAYGMDKNMAGNMRPPVAKET